MNIQRVDNLLVNSGLPDSTAAELADILMRRPDGAGTGDTVLLFDSMTDWYHFGGGALSSATYNASTGVMTLVFSAAHNMDDGSGCRLWHYGYPALRDQFYVPARWVSTTTVTLQLPANLEGVPSGVNIATGLFPYFDNHRAAASWVNWLQMLSGWRLRIVRNAAQSGDTSAGNRRRLDRDVLAFRPAIVLGHCVGINDLSVSNGPQSEAQIIDNLRNIFDRVLATGAKLVVGTLSPVGASEPRGTRENMMSVLRINDFLREYARNARGFYLVDTYRHFVDISNANGLALTTRIRDVDFIHYATKTAVLAARDFLPVVNMLAPFVDSTLPKTVLDAHAKSRLTLTGPGTVVNGVMTLSSTNHGYKVGDEFFIRGASAAAANGPRTVLSVVNANSFTTFVPNVADGSVTGMGVSRSRHVWQNPLLLDATGGTTGAGTTGTVAAFLTCSNGGTQTTFAASASVVAASNVAAGAPGFDLPVLGNAQRLTVTLADAASRPQFTTVGTSALTNEVFIGRSYIFEGILKMTSTNWALTPIRQVLIQATVTTNAGDVQKIAITGQDTSEANSYAQDMRMHFRTPVIRVNLPGATSITSVSFLVACTNEVAFTTGPQLVLELENPSWLDVTDREADYL